MNIFSSSPISSGGREAEARIVDPYYKHAWTLDDKLDERRLARLRFVVASNIIEALSLLLFVGRARALGVSRS
jgi:hypothetical protein